MSKKKLLINVSMTIPFHKGEYISGIGRSTISLLNAFNDIPSIPFDIELYASGFKSLRLNTFNWKFKSHKLPIPLSKKLTFKGWGMYEAYLRNLFFKSDLFHSPENIDVCKNNEPYVLTIHDCIQINNDNITHFKKCAQNARAIVTCSEYTKSDIVRILDVSPEKIHVIYWGVDCQKFRILSLPDISNKLDKFDLKNKHYFFSCSCSDKRKNVRNALIAFSTFLKANPNANVSFVLLWSNPLPSLTQEFYELISQKKIIFLPNVTDDDLVALYNGAIATVFISRYEGFGFPILESFACGTPVITCKNSSLPEVGKDAAVYVGEDDVNCLSNIYSDFVFNRLGDFSLKLKNVVSLFSWEKTANEYIKFYSQYI